MTAAPPITEQTAAPLVVRERSPGLHLATVARGGIQELHLTLSPLPNESPASMARRLDAVLKERAAAVARHEVFGAVAARAEFLSRAGSQAEQRWPVTWVQGGSCAAGPIAGMHVFAVSGAPVETLWLGPRAVGRVFSDRHARHCLLGDLLPVDANAPRDAQARQLFQQLESALGKARLRMTDVARTWLFPDDILGWYGPLNQARREFFERHQLFKGVLPASTGIGARNPAGAAIVAGAWAAQPLDGRFFVGEVLSPMQCPAPAYGSCFSRAVELVSPDLRRVFVSGTASIEPKGASVCAGDVDGQIDITLQVVRAILVSRGMDYPDVVRATAYLRHPEDAPLFQRWRARLGIEGWPLVINQAVICRDELLFEIEVDAVAPSARHKAEAPQGS